MPVFDCEMIARPIRERIEKAAASLGGHLKDRYNRHAHESGKGLLKNFFKRPLKQNCFGKITKLSAASEPGEIIVGCWKLFLFHRFPNIMSPLERSKHFFLKKRLDFSPFRPKLLQMKFFGVVEYGRGGVVSKLNVGDEAPEFIALTDGNDTVRLRDFRGQTVILYFYPQDNTPG